MTDRYEIQDILTQGPEGVRFLAEDHQRGQFVELLRFFPFGPDEGGLDESEVQTFHMGLDRLIQLNLPKLRAVYDGGVDPHDGIPFMVVDAVGEKSLERRLESGPIEADKARALAESALDLCLKLSEQLGEERVWIGTSLETIGFDDEGSQPVITFGLSPLRWLGQDAHVGGLYPLLELIESAGGWRGRMISGTMGNGFGRWLRELRNHAKQWTLREARNALYEATRQAANPGTITSPAATTSQITSPMSTTSQGTTPWASAKSDTSRLIWPWVAFGAVVLIAMGGLGFVFLSGPEGNQSADSSPPEKPLTQAEKINARAAELTSKRARASVIPVVPPGPASREKNAKLIALGRHLRAKTGETFEFESTVHGVRQSNSGKTLYIEFGSTHEPNALLARHRVVEGGFTLDDLRAFKNQKIRIRGEVVADPSGRIAIDLSGPSALELVSE